jgi:hypothetical protein
VLMSAVNLSSINAVLGANGVLNSFVGSSEMILLALTASIFSFSIALIPFIASRIVRGDVGSTMLTMIGTMTAAAGAVASLAAASFAGLGEGAVASQAAGRGGTAPSPPSRDEGGASSGGAAAAGYGPSAGGAGTAAYASMPPTPPSAGGASTDAHSAGESSAAPSTVAPASSQPPSASPWRSSSRPGQYRGFNIPHAMAWYVGYSLGSAYRGVRGKE